MSSAELPTSGATATQRGAHNGQQDGPYCARDRHPDHYWRALSASTYLEEKGRPRSEDSRTCPDLPRVVPGNAERRIRDRAPRLGQTSSASPTTAGPSVCRRDCTEGKAVCGRTCEGRASLGVAQRSAPSTDACSHRRSTDAAYETTAASTRATCEGRGSIRCSKMGRNGATCEGRDSDCKGPASWRPSRAHQFLESASADKDPAAEAETTRARRPTDRLGIRIVFSPPRLSTEVDIFSADTDRRVALLSPAMENVVASLAASAGEDFDDQGTSKLPMGLRASRLG